MAAVGNPLCDDDETRNASGDSGSGSGASGGRKDSGSSASSSAGTSSSSSASGSGAGGGKKKAHHYATKAHERAPTKPSGPETLLDAGFEGIDALTEKASATLEEDLLHALVMWV
jgi:hypothetical protein|tara:strand:- start:286 stop:630 length:345 start_codon:yes stop_codon:yes gene_type:complete